MTVTSAGRSIAGDWYAGTIPQNAVVDETAFIETSFSFHMYRSRLPTGFRAGRGASTYLGTMLDVGESGSVSIGDFSLVHGARIICDREITIGDYSLISWNVVLMDSYRLPRSPSARRRLIEGMSLSTRQLPPGGDEARPVHIGRNVWIGFDSCVLPGVTVGEGAVIGARSVVFEDVASYTVVAGNPARLVRRIESTATTTDDAIRRASAS